MRPTSTSIIALIALLASPSFATPLPISTTRASRSVIGIGTINGTPTGLVGDLLNKVDGLFGRDLFNAEHARRDLGSIIQDASTLSPDDKQTVKTALMNKISTLEGSDVSSRAFVGAIGSAVAGGAASAVVGNLLSQVENLFRRDEFNAHVNRDLASIINDASSLPPSDKQTVKTALMNKISTLDESDVAARALAGTIGSAIGGAASAVVGNLLGQIENLFRRDDLGVVARTESWAINELE